jgi:tetratricopeptide (TPR) repeat protein
MTDEERAAIVAEGRSLAKRIGDTAAHVGFLIRVGMAEALVGRIGVAHLELLLEARDLADTTDNPMLKALARGPMALSFAFGGRLREAIALCEEAQEMAPSEESPRLLYLKAFILIQLGRLIEAGPVADRAIELAREADELPFLASAHGARVMLARLAGDREAALEHGRRAVEIEERVGSQAGLTMAYHALGSACLLNERWEEARDAFLRGRSIVEESGAGHLFERMILPDLAEVHLALGNTREANKIAREAVEKTEGQDSLGIPARISLAQILIRSEGPSAREAIESALEKAAALLEKTGAKAHAPSLHEARAEFAQLLGDEAIRERELREAHRLFTEIGATGHAQRVARELDS